ncbi:hypothetical protein P7C73_g4508, partial [Tremellales sp. Uapishka_1]
MPTFQPPLSHTAFVRVDSARDNFIHLTFSASFADGEDTSGTWEIWTDLPSSDEQGDQLSSDGQWRAAQFVHANNGSKHNLHQDLEGSVHLAADIPPSAASTSTTTLYLENTILATPGRAYAYTYRHVLPSGEVHWLGGEGGNGVIRIQEGGVAAQQSGEWQGGGNLTEGMAWSGLGIDFSEPRPRLTYLPSDAHSAASLLFLRGRPGPDVEFYQISAASSFSPTSFPTLVILSKDLSSMSIAPSNALPEARDAIYAFQRCGLFADTVGSVLSSTDTDKLIRVESSDPTVIAFLYAPSSLILYAPSHLEARSTTLTLPTSLSRKPLLLALPDNKLYFSAHTAGLTSPEARSLHLLLAPGETSVVGHFTEFIKFGDGWICSPGALEYRVGEEESKSIPEEPDLTVSPTTEPLDSTPVADSDVPEDADDEVQDEGVKPAISGLQGFLEVLGSFFASFWNLLFGALGARPVTSQADVVEDEGREPATVNERTPLLSETPELSRTTSSTAFSATPIASPLSETVSQVPYLSLTKTFSTSPTRPPQPPTKTHLQFTFAFSATPTFILSPETRVAGLSFKVRPQGEAEWRTAVPVVQDDSNGYIEVGLGLEAAEWEVRAEKL